MKKMMSLSVLAAASVVSLSAMAGGYQPVMPNSHFYVSGNLGYGALSTPREYLRNTIGGGNFDGSYNNGGVSGGAAVGYLRSFNENFDFGAELGYQHLGSAEYKTTVALTPYTLKYANNAIDLLGVLQYHFTPVWTLSAKAGLAYVMQSITANTAYKNSIVGKLTDKSKVLPELAVGVGYQVADNVMFGAEVSHVFGDKIAHVNSEKYVLNAANLNKVASTTNVLANVTYYFK